MKQLHDASALESAIESSGFAGQFSFDARKFAQLYSARRGEYILREGEPTNFLYYVVQGRLKLRHSLPNGKATLLDFPKAPCFIGEMELLGARSEPLEVRALEPCLLLGMRVSDCRELLLNDCRFLRGLCVYLASKELMKTAALSREHAYPLANRLAEFVLRSSPDGQYRESNTDASEYLGVSYRHLQQVLGEFVKKGYLQKTGAGYALCDAKSLEALAREMEAQE